jgi:hypothetical protein
VVDPTTSTLGEVITEKPVQDLLLNGRNFMDLIPLTAGVAPPPGATAFFISGSRDAGTAFLIEGADITSPSSDMPRVLPNFEGIGEFKITTNNFDAEYGRAMGGIIDTHIRSGTNTWHGSLFEYVRNTVLDARDFFDVNRLPYKTPWDLYTPSTEAFNRPRSHRLCYPAPFPQITSAALLISRISAEKASSAAADRMSPEWFAQIERVT